MSEAHVPTDIKISKDKDSLTLLYQGDGSAVFSAEFLRVHSPSAEVQGHSKSQKKLISGKRNVTIASIEAVGNYAIQISFDDGHNTGLFSWRFFDKFAATYDETWADYLEELKQAGVSR